MKNRLNLEQARALFESNINRAATALRTVAKTVEEHPHHFDQAQMDKVVIFLTNQLHGLEADIRAAIRAAPIKGKFSLDGSYAPVKAEAPTTVRIKPAPVLAEPEEGLSYGDIAALEKLEEPSVYEPTAPKGRRMALGRLTGTKEMVFAFDGEMAPDPTDKEPATEKPDRTGGIIDAGFIDD